MMLTNQRSQWSTGSPSELIPRRHSLVVSSSRVYSSTYFFVTFGMAVNATSKLSPLTSIFLLVPLASPSTHASRCCNLSVGVSVAESLTIDVNRDLNESHSAYCPLNLRSVSFGREVDVVDNCMTGVAPICVGMTPSSA
ncbi:hypothetical protein TKK_0019085 [Trichogramma kaykai]